MPGKIYTRATSNGSEPSIPNKSQTPLSCLPQQYKADLECLAMDSPLVDFNLDHREAVCALPIAHAHTPVECPQAFVYGGNTYVWTRANMVFRLNSKVIRVKGHDLRCLEILIPLYENTTQDFPSDGIAEQLVGMLRAKEPPRHSFKRGSKRVYREFDKDRSLEKIEDAYRALEWSLADRGYGGEYWVNSVAGEKKACRAKVLPWLEGTRDPAACIPLKQWKGEVA